MWQTCNSVYISDGGWGFQHQNTTFSHGRAQGKLPKRQHFPGDPRRTSVSRTHLLVLLSPCHEYVTFTQVLQRLDRTAWHWQRGKGHAHCALSQEEYRSKVGQGNQLDCSLDYNKIWPVEPDTDRQSTLHFRGGPITLTHLGPWCIFNP